MTPTDSSVVAQMRHDKKDCQRRNASKTAEEHQCLPPGQRDEQKCRHGWQCHLSNVTGEIIGAERFQGPRSCKGVGNQ
jgi:hypothetical protein